MIVAIATEANMVASHFGRCPEYTLFQLDQGVINEQRVISNPGHEPGFLPEYLAELGVNCIIAGGMGPRAQMLFTDKKINTLVGVTGPVQDVIEAYLAGELRSGPSSCEHSAESHGCD